jgi:uncharacterized metal-binding protein
MSRSDWSHLIIKLFALSKVLYGFVAAASIVSTYIYLIPTDQHDFSRNYIPLILNFVTPVLFPILFGVIIWKKAERISDWIWRNRKAFKSGGLENIKVAEIKVSAVTFLGLYFFVVSLTAAFGILTKIYVNWVELPGFPLYRPQDYAFWISVVVQLVTSIVLVTKPKAVLRFLDGAQHTWDRLE